MEKRRRKILLEKQGKDLKYKMFFHKKITQVCSYDLNRTLVYISKRLALLKQRFGPV